MGDIQITRVSMRYESTKIGEYEPGTGTNYKVIAVPWHYAGSMNALGRVTGGWLVVNCNNRKAYLFQKEPYLTDNYIQEKLGGYHDDYPHLGNLVRKILEREVKE